MQHAWMPHWPLLHVFLIGFSTLASSTFVGQGISIHFKCEKELSASGHMYAAPVCEGWACRFQTGPSRRCRLHRTPGSGSCQTSGRGADCRKVGREMCSLQVLERHTSIHQSSEPRHSPQVRPAVDQVKDLRRVEQLLEATQELHPLVVAAFGVDEDQEGAGTRGGAGGLPETCSRAHGVRTITHIYIVRACLYA